MERTVLSPLHTWDSFYVILGSSAAALTGLQFVAYMRRRREGYEDRSEISDEVMDEKRQPVA